MPVKAHNQTFTIERVLAKCPAHVFSAWSEPDKKRKWFAASPNQAESHVLDFSVGGREYGAFENEMGLHENETRYFEIVPDELIVFSYSMAMNKRVHSVSLVTVRFADMNGGTRLIYTEQMCVIEPSDGAAGREHGWNALLDGMASVLEAEAA
ncbi:MAG: SRPBCC family protein [Alphaproteobacteria bacterium]|nr:SRPBCC family protein [Alphaproteobacteria bacterium]